MKTWTLRMTPPDGPATTHEGLSELETMQALRNLMYGDYTAVARTSPQRDEGTTLRAAA
jgi:hypothetical protein